MSHSNFEHKGGKPEITLKITLPILKQKHLLYERPETVLLK